MSSTPVGTGAFSIVEISLPRRSASGTPRRLMPINTMPSPPWLFSTISCARRTSVRSISEADISLPFTRREVFSVASLMGYSRCSASRRMIRGRAGASKVERKDREKTPSFSVSRLRPHHQLRAHGAARYGQAHQYEFNQHQAANCRSRASLCGEQPCCQGFEDRTCRLRILAGRACLLPLLRSLRYKCLPEIVEILALMKNKAFDIEKGSHRSKRNPARNQPCHQPDARTRAGYQQHRASRRTLSAHIQQHPPCSRCRNPKQSQKPQERCSKDQPCRNRQQQSHAQRRLPFHSARLVQHRVPLGCLRRHNSVFTGVHQLRQSTVGTI